MFGFRHNSGHIVPLFSGLGSRHHGSLGRDLHHGRSGLFGFRSGHGGHHNVHIRRHNRHHGSEFFVGFGFYPGYHRYYSYPYVSYPYYPYYPTTTYIESPPVYYQNVVVQSPPADSYQSGEDATAPSGVGPITQPYESEQGSTDQKQTTTDAAQQETERLNKLMVEGTDLFTQAMYEQAARSFSQVQTADPNNVDAILAYALARFAAGDYPASANAVRKGIRLVPEVVNSTFDVRDRYGSMADYDSHLNAVENYARGQLDNLDGLITLGFVQHFSGQRKLAAGIFKEVKQRSETDAALADVFLEAKPLEELLEAERKAQAAEADKENN